MNMRRILLGIVLGFWPQQHLLFLLLPVWLFIRMALNAIDGMLAREFNQKSRLGAYLKAIQEADERFTGRVIKNITDAIKVRAMDFELPDEWMEKPELFLTKDYATKLAMISELARPITVEMVIQEINRYADSEFRYADKSDEAAIDNAVRDMGRMEEAKKRYLEQRT